MDVGAIHLPRLAVPHSVIKGHSEVPIPFRQPAVHVIGGGVQVGKVAEKVSQVQLGVEVADVGPKEFGAGGAIWVQLRQLGRKQLEGFGLLSASRVAAPLSIIDL